MNTAAMPAPREIADLPPPSRAIFATSGLFMK